MLNPSVQFLYFDNKQDFLRKKKSINKSNTEYVYSDDVKDIIETGVPEILWGWICFIKSTQEIYLNNTYYSLSVDKIDALNVLIENYLDTDNITPNVKNTLENLQDSVATLQNEFNSMMGDSDTVVDAIDTFNEIVHFLESIEGDTLSEIIIEIKDLISEVRVAANDAQDTADNALELAETANTKADAAQSTANNALAELGDKVDKVDNKSLVDNTEIEKLTELPTAQEITNNIGNAIEAIINDISSNVNDSGNNFNIAITQTAGKITNIEITNDNTINPENIQPGSGIDIELVPDSSLVKINHSNSITSHENLGKNSNTDIYYGGDFKIPVISYDNEGHITATEEQTIKIPSLPVVEEGYVNGCIEYNGVNIPVKGLKSAAFTDSDIYATAAQGIKADNAVPNTRKINGHALNADITLTAEDVNLGNVTNESKETMFTSPNFTGTPTAPTVNVTTNTTQIATTEFVQGAIEHKLAANDAMLFKGFVDGTHNLPVNGYSAGWTYKVKTAGTYAGYKCEIGDMLLATEDAADNQTSINNSHWMALQANIDGAVTGPTTAVANQVAVFDGTSGKVIKDSGYTIASNVPANAKFTDTTYNIPYNLNITVNYNTIATPGVDEYGNPATLDINYFYQNAPIQAPGGTNFTNEGFIIGGGINIMSYDDPIKLGTGTQHRISLGTDIITQVYKNPVDCYLTIDNKNNYLGGDVKLYNFEIDHTASGGITLGTIGHNYYNSAHLDIRNSHNILYGNIELGTNTRIGAAFSSNRPVDFVEIGKRVYIDDDVNISQDVSGYSSYMFSFNHSISPFDQPITINSSVWIGHNTTIYGNTTIGYNVQLGNDLNTNASIHIQPSVYIDTNTTIGQNVNIQKATHIDTSVNIGANVSIGRNVKINANVNIGENAKIGQNVNIPDNLKFEVMTAAQYANLATKDANTLYFII